MIRLPVRFKGQPLMPMRSYRVAKFIRLHRGRIRYDRKLNIHYLQLLVNPSGFKTQDITLGIDPGSSFDGLSIVSDDTHHFNIELIQRPKKGKTAIKFFKGRQATNRRVRRSYLRHRPIRFNNRTKNKLSPTIQANIDFRKWVITKLLKIYPITKVVIEDVRFNHSKSTNGRAFSLVEQGKTELYQWIKNQGVLLELYEGFNTKKLRVNSFGSDPKIKDKGSKAFEAHCVDSFVLACNKGLLIDKETGEILEDQPVVLNNLEIMKNVIFIEKKVKIRRCLTRNRKRQLLNANYYKLNKGGVKEYYRNISSHRNICRVKIDENSSNHPKHWKYIDNGFSDRIKHSVSRYGGTVVNGHKKFYINGEWINHIIS